MSELRLDLSSLRTAYIGGLKPSEVIDFVYDEIEKSSLNPVWISLTPRSRALAIAEGLVGTSIDALPLYGIPFAIKDNIDAAELATTAACPDFSYIPKESATVVKLLEQAGAILVGKTNMDQFATGLVGTRTPFGACSCIFDSRYISGGSSSGSAIAVASGLVSFALGTDTAGSGRVPAAFNNIVGLKPTRGSISTTGVLPACRTLDCVSIFALTCNDARTVFEVARGFDWSDPYSLTNASDDVESPWLEGPFSFGTPAKEDLRFFGDLEAEALYFQAANALESIGGKQNRYDYGPFRAAADLLYSGPWVAERLAAVEPFFSEHADSVHPIVRDVISSAVTMTAADAFRGEYLLQKIKRVVSETWKSMDVLLLPTTGTIYTHAEIESEPIKLNSNLGYYTNFVNLLDLAAVAIPAGFRLTGLPFGATLIGKPHTEQSLLMLADKLHRCLAKSVGNLSISLNNTAKIEKAVAPPGCILTAVVGAHLSGQPLNYQLTNCGAKLVKTTSTSDSYRLYALSNTSPPKPALVRDESGSGSTIEVEIWAIPTTSFGHFVNAVPFPLGIGNVTLADGTSVKGFICESFALAHAVEITHHGGWRKYLEYSTSQ